jgi:ATP-dependent helicase Lhr and Lhr-like helicase
MGREMPENDPSDPLAALAGPVGGWFSSRYPAGPTQAQRLVWPRVDSGENLLLVSPTGTGKTLAAFLAIIARLLRDHAIGRLGSGLRCVYVSPLRSLGYDIERNLAEPLEAIRCALGRERSPVAVGVRTGDTSAAARRRLRLEPPHLLITTPESLALLLSQPAWLEKWQEVENIIVDEIHSLVPTKRGADLAVSLERLAALAARDPCRIGLSATCRPAEPVARYLVGPSRTCQVLEATGERRAAQLDLRVESLLRRDEAVHRGLTYRRLLRRLGQTVAQCRTTIIFANTRSFTEKITHDLRRAGEFDSAEVAAHHSALDARRRRSVEAALKAGALRAVVTSTSLELGVDIGSADLTVMVGLPGGVARCLQRVGRSGHAVGHTARGLMLVATPAELAGAAITAHAARAGKIEALRVVDAPLDVVCQQVIGMACVGDWDAELALLLLRKAEPMATLTRADFDACLSFLAGAPVKQSNEIDCDPTGSPRWSSPRIWLRAGRFGLHRQRVRRWLWKNIGTIISEESVRVVANGIDVGSLDASFAEHLQPGDRFVLDGRALEFRRLEGFLVVARVTEGEPSLPRWSSERQGLTTELAVELASFREEAARRMLVDGSNALSVWLRDSFGLDREAAGVLEDLFEAQELLSEIPRTVTLLVEEFPHAEGFTYAFHAPLSRAACEALGRATAARLGRHFGRNLSLIVADLGWAIRLPDGARIDAKDLPALLALENFREAVLEGLDRGELLARRFRHVASTALMVLRNPDGPRRRVGGLLWVSQRLYPLMKKACPDHPLLRETRREVLADLLDAPAALAWLGSRPALRFRQLAAPSPFTVAWIDPSSTEAVCFETAADALKRLHSRLMSQGV